MNDDFKMNSLNSPKLEGPLIRKVSVINEVNENNLMVNSLEQRQDNIIDQISSNHRILSSNFKKEEK